MQINPKISFPISLLVTALIVWLLWVKAGKGWGIAVGIILLGLIWFGMSFSLGGQNGWQQLFSSQTPKKEPQIPTKQGIENMPQYTRMANSQNPSPSRTQINGIRKVQREGIFNANGTPVNIGANLKQKSCGEICADLGATGKPSWSVEPYPKGSKYYGSYMCWCHMGETS